MSKKHVTLLTCDVHEGEVDAETFDFSHDSKNYQIDLCPDHAHDFEAAKAAMAEWADFAAPLSKRARGKAASNGSRRKSSDASPQEIRAWGKENGYLFNDRGRVPKRIVEAYYQAH